MGRRVKQCRRERGWTQRELATRSGVPQGLISQLESGVRENVTVEVAARLARAFRVGLEWLVGYTPFEEEERTKPQAICVAGE